jgi:MFS transporter, ACS family, L-galactonate transporter
MPGEPMRPADEWDQTVLSQRRQLLILGFLMLTGILNYLDRVSLSIANPIIRKELFLSGTQMGSLLAAFSLAYGLGQIPAGTLVKRFGFRRVLGGSLLAWSAAQMVTSLVRSNPGFQALRAILGLGEAPFFPAVLDAVQSSFAPKRRGRAMSLVNTSTILGQALAPPVLTVLMLWVGWRGMFALIGLAGLAFAAIWLTFGHGRSAHLSDKTKSQEGEPAPFSFRELFADPDLLVLLRTRTMWGMMLGFGGINYTAWLYLTWLPGYLASEYHLKLGATGMISGIPFAAGAVGMLASGILADFKVRDPQQSMTYRRYLIVIGMVLSAGCTALVVRATSLSMAVAAISMAVLFIHFAGTAAWNLIHVSTAARLSAQVGALQSMGSYAIASAGPVITGWLLDRTHSFHIALLICSGVTTAGALAYLTMTLKPIMIGHTNEKMAVVQGSGSIREI